MWRKILRLIHWPYCPVNFLLLEHRDIKSTGRDAELNVIYTCKHCVSHTHTLLLCTLTPSVFDDNAGVLSMGARR